MDVKNATGFRGDIPLVEVFSSTCRALCRKRFGSSSGFLPCGLCYTAQTDCGHESFRLTHPKEPHSDPFRVGERVFIWCSAKYQPADFPAKPRNPTSPAPHTSTEPALNAPVSR